MPFKPLRYRQIHLDFHTSEHIPGIGADFDAAEFIAVLKAAHVDSITIFAKCHHGWSYYPTKAGAVHPQLSRPDLMGDMLAAGAAADIEMPVYISVQWDERTARAHPEWRVVSATNRYAHGLAIDGSALQQLSPAWHTICLNHAGYRAELLAQAREVVRGYAPPGLFFDIIGTHGCVCQACLDRMADHGLNPEDAADRLINDEAVNAHFRTEMSDALWTEFPDLRIFYNYGHISKQGRGRFAAHSHLELESLPTGGWGYDHFPSSARYAATLGMDFLGQTGKFHTSWGEFGGFKHPHALEYEVMQMAALGAKCLIGDQLHPRGAINRDTYASLTPAYARLQALEPFLRGAEQVTEIAILSSEHMHPHGDRNSAADDGAVQVMLELKRTFDVIDTGMDFARYPLLILPDDIVVDAGLAERLTAYLLQGGKLILTGRSGFDADGRMMGAAGVTAAPTITQNPTYVQPAPGLTGLTSGPFVIYGTPVGVQASGATVLADVMPSYFDRTWAHFCSHQHTPDDPTAAPTGPAMTIMGNVGYIAYPIFGLYRAVGQSLYKGMVKSLLDRLLPDAVLTSSLTSGGRSTLTHQPAERRYVAHLLYGPPQLRGKDLRAADGSSRQVEMIEDIPTLGPIDVTVRLAENPFAVCDAATGAALDFAITRDGVVQFTLPDLHIHRAVALMY